MTETKTLNQRLAVIQSELKAPKGQKNNFGNYFYRSCEDILNALKPLLKAQDCVLTLTDEIVYIGTRYYVQATATIKYELSEFSVKALAREEETKKGMDASQITGSASSYARKYALNGLFAIDDTKDADVDKPQEDTGKVNEKQLTWLNTVFGSEKGAKQLPNFLTAFNVKSLNELTEEQAADMISQIRSSAKK